MNRKTIILLVGFVSGVSTFCSMLNVPFDIGRFSQGPIHSEFAKDSQVGWVFDAWGSGYSRSAMDTFKDDDLTDTENLASIVFGKSSFRVEESFEGAFSAQTATNYPYIPWMRISNITPKLDYNESGFMLGIHCGYVGCDGKAHYGFRASIPLRIVEVKNDEMDYGVSLDDVYRDREEIIEDGTTKSTWVARLDFLSSLLSDTGITTVKKLVDYKNTSEANYVTMADQRVSGVVDVATGQPNVGLIGSENGTLPSVQTRTSVKPTAISGSLDADGALNNLDKARFLAGDSVTGAKDYVVGGLSADRDAQSKLFVYPLFDNNNDIAGPASTIRSEINTIVDKIEDSVKDYLDIKDITFDSQRRVGLGDLDLNFYFGYDLTKRIYGEGELGLTLPTAKTNDDLNNLLKPTLGNNGHVEILLGTQWKFDVSRCFNIDINASYSFALKSKEKRLAAFEDATVKNFGSLDDVLNADVSWKWFDGRAEFTLFHPNNECFGMTAGYEFYFKTEDKVTFEESTHGGFTLSGDTLALRTKQIAHKLQFEIFNYFDQFELFVGGSQVFAGKNTPKESQMYFGVKVDF